MRCLVICFVAILAVAQWTELARADETLRIERNQIRPLAELLTDLSSDDEKKREDASEAAWKVVIQFIIHNKSHHQMLYSEIAGEVQPVSEQQLAKWKKELVALTPQMLEFLKIQPIERWGVVSGMLCVVDPTGVKLFENRDVLRGHPFRYVVCIQELVMIGSHVAPRDQSILGPAVALLTRLTPAECQELEKILNELGNGMGITLTGMSFQLIAADQVQTELPILISLLSAEQSNVLRVMTLYLIILIGEDAAPALPTIEQMLDEDDVEIRQMAAQAIVALSPRTVDVESLAVRAKLEGKDLAEFREVASECLEEATKYGWKFGVINDVVPMMKYLLEQGHQFDTREGLRGIIALAEAGKDVASAKPFINKLLQSEKLDDETRRLALLVIKSLR